MQQTSSLTPLPSNFIKISLVGYVLVANLATNISNVGR